MPTELQFDTPGLADVIADVDALEILRHLQLPRARLSIKTLMRLTERPREVLQAKLDELCAVGLVRQVLAGRASRDIRYRVTTSEICIRFDASDPEAVRRTGVLSQMFSKRMQGIIEASQAEPTPGMPAWTFVGTYLPYLTKEEQIELRSRIRWIARYLSALEGRSKKRGPGAESVASSDATPYAVAFQVRPLAKAVTPWPVIRFISNRADPNRAARADAVLSALTPREAEIARMLADGMSRPGVAKALGVSTHTVGTLSGRIYRKLGVRSRAHLAQVILGSV